MMLTSVWIAAAALAAPAASAPAVYRVVDVERREVFAGRLGRRVAAETLVLDQAGRTLRIEVRGAYHTRAMAAGRVFAAGQTVGFRHAPRGNTVARDDVFILR